MSADVIRDEVAVVVSAFAAGRIDGHQAIASLAAKTARLLAEAEERGAAKVRERVEAAADAIGDHPWKPECMNDACRDCLNEQVIHTALGAEADSAGSES